MSSFACYRQLMMIYFLLMERLGPVQKKILLLFHGIAAIGLSYNLRQQIWILKQIGREWNKINQQALNRAIKSLYESKLIDIKEGIDGATKITITQSGKTKSIEFKIDEMNIKKPKIWDKKWRIVVFDIPEKHKKAREAIRECLNNLGFYKFQKSVFVLPFECSDEIDFITEYFNVRSYVRLILAETMDNELHLKKIFNLL